MTGGGGDCSARSIAGRTGGAGRDVADARKEDEAGRRADGRDARAGGEVGFCRGRGTATFTFSGFSAATRSVAATVAGGLSVPVVDAATVESRTTSTCGKNSRTADVLVRRTSTYSESTDGFSRFLTAAPPITANPIDTAITPTAPTRRRIDRRGSKTGFSESRTVVRCAASACPDSNGNISNGRVI
jgi:hypothetical protein